MDPQDWAPVAGQAVGVFGQVPMPVQIATIIALTTIFLSALAAWFFKKDTGANMVPAHILISVTDELSRQVSHLSAAVESTATVVKGLQETITGCRDCPFHPNNDSRAVGFADRDADGRHF